MRHALKSILFGAVLAAGMSSSASAAVLTLTVDNVATDGELSNSSNFVKNYAIGAFSKIVGISYNLTVAATSPSYLSEASILFSDSAGFDGVFATPGINDDDPGTQTYSASFDLAALGIAFLVGSDGILRVEYYEGFDDASVSTDALINGTIDVTYDAVATTVPEPATWSLMIGGFGLVGGVLRRSRRVPALA